ncbi:MAG: sigma 54-interacting transcriptional regulator [Chitinivibrionia bacterium]|nr:sigma 54-interacting transcriptional regulator [Chitinivibrionia bacterium]
MPFPEGGVLRGCISLASLRQPLDVSQALGDRYLALGELFAGFILNRRAEKLLIESEDGLRRSEEKMRALLNTLPDPAFIIDQGGRFEYVFASDASLLYREPSEVLGKTIHEIFDRQTANAFLELVRATISSGKSLSHRYSLDVPAGKRYFEGRTSLLSAHGPGAGKIIWMARDITEQVHADRITAVQNEFNVLSTSRLGLDDMLEQSLRKAVAVSEMDCGGIYLVDERIGDISLMHHTGLSDAFIDRVAYAAADAARAKTVMRGEPVYSQFQEIELSRDPELMKEGLRALAVIPIKHEGKVLACINVGSHTLDVVPDHSRIALESLAAYIGTALAAAKAEEDARRHVQTIQSIYRAAPVGIGLVKDRVLCEVNDNVCSMLGYSRHELLGQSTRMLYPSQEEFENVGHAYYSQLRVAGKGMLETRMRHKNGTIIDILVSASALDRDDLGGGVTFTLLDISGYKRAQREIAELLEFEKLISGISVKFVNVPLDGIDKEIEGVMKSLGEFFHADRCAIILESPDTQKLFPYCVWESGALEPHQRIIPSGLSNLLAEYWKRGMPADLGDIEKDSNLSEELRETMKRMRYRSLITVPLKIGDRWFGGCGISSFENERAWPEKIVNRLRLIGEILANALLRKSSEESLRQALSEIQQLKDRLQSENIYLKEALKGRRPTTDIIGESEALRKILKQIDQVAATSSTILLTGETGTGKGLIARAIHETSPRRDRQIIEINCATLPATLAESELFGHEKGAFTGAQARKIGRFELAHGSTIFLDEVGELSGELQAKLLRVLHEGSFERLGGSNTLHADVRVIAASNRDLAKEVDEGRFRQDLYYRLNVFPIHVPPLRERVEDIPLLAWKFVGEFSKAMRKRIDTIPQKHIEAMKRYSWPGNIRELRNVIERAVIINTGSTLDLDPLSLVESTRGGARLEDMERTHIQAMLEKVGWRVRGKGGAAELLGLKPTTLYSRMQKLGLKKPEKSVDI